MKKIRFAKLHGAENDFLLSWSNEAPDGNLPEVARRICSRYTGVGADGWMLVSRREGGLKTRLFNSDGSEPEISGNGTRCAAAFALWSRVVEGETVLIETAAGLKTLWLLSRHELSFALEMDMGKPHYKPEEIRTKIDVRGQTVDATLLNVGNPQCAVFVREFPDDWKATAALLEGHERFPNRSNVSFVKVLGEHDIDVRFYERGAGETRSSGTGSTGAAVASTLRGDVRSPVTVHTPAGEMTLRWDESVFLTGPAEFIAEGEFLLAD